MLIRALSPINDLDRVTRFYADAPDYWELAEGIAPGPTKAMEFFTDTPPGCDPDASHRPGLFQEEQLCGIGELSFGFPAAGDAYLGFMMLGPWARGAGLGREFLEHMESVARENHATNLFLAVLESNPRGHAFWTREGFLDTGIQGIVSTNSIKNKLFRLVKTLRERTGS